MIAVAGLGVLALMMALPVRTWLSYKQAKLTDQQARELVNRELPIGSDKLAVKQFLEARRWAYSDSGPMIRAMVRDAARNGVIRTDIRLQFFFDAGGKLISYEMQDIFTGP